MSRLKFRIYASKHGNVFMHEIASLVGCGLVDLGYDVQILNDGLPGLVEDTVNLVVAPHEYFLFLRTFSREDRLEAARSCVLISTEQPGTPWFEESLEYCRESACVLDINSSAVMALAHRGVRAHFLPLGYHQSWDIWRGQLSDRSIDIVFMASSTPKRDEFLARHANVLTNLRCELIISRPDAPAIGEAADFVTGVRRLKLLSRAKLLLNVHRGDHGSFEWHRALAALANGCVVVTEPAHDYAPLVPFEHFVPAALDMLPQYATSLLSDEALRQRIAQQVYRFLVEERSQANLLRPVLPVIDDQRPRMRKSSRQWRRPRARTAPRSRTPAQQAHPGQNSLPAATEIWVRRILLNQIALRRSIESVQAQVEHPDGGEYWEVQTPTYAAASPDVTVVVTLHDGAHHVAKSLASVVGSLDVLPEIVVIDDHSSDSGADVAREFMARHDHYPMILRAFRVNRGAPEARNSGFGLARTDHVFVLDAGHLIYPRTLSVLRNALRHSGSEFAYGIITRAGSTHTLLNKFPWDVQRLVKHNYIEGMAMVRRTAWEAVGGYASTDAVFGLEDYAFWLGFAEHGFTGSFVREIVGQYRENGSTLALSNLAQQATADYLRSRYSTLPWDLVA